MFRSTRGGIYCNYELVVSSWRNLTKIFVGIYNRFATRCPSAFAWVLIRSTWGSLQQKWKEMSRETNFEIQGLALASVSYLGPIRDSKGMSLMDDGT